MTDHEDGFSSKLLRINTKYRTADSISNTDFYFQFGTSDVIDNIYRIALTRLGCLYMFPNITPYNNKLVYDRNETTETITVPVGQYTATELAGIVTSLSAGKFTMTINEDTNRFEFLDPLYELTIGPSNDLNTMAATIGVTSVVTIAAGATTAVTTTPDLSGPRHIYVESPNICQSNCLDGNTDSGGYLPLLEVIPLAGIPYGYVVSYNANDLVSSDVDFKKAVTLRRIHIRLTDSHRNTLVMPPNQDIDIILKVFYKV
jgi:hypothetical protein